MLYVCVFFLLLSYVVIIISLSSSSSLMVFLSLFNNSCQFEWSQNTVHSANQKPCGRVLTPSRTHPTLPSPAIRPHRVICRNTDIDIWKYKAIT